MLIVFYSLMTVFSELIIIYIFYFTFLISWRLLIVTYYLYVLLELCNPRM